MNLSGVAVGGVVESVAAVAEMTGGVVPVAVVTDCEVSMCGGMVIVVASCGVFAIDCGNTYECLHKFQWNSEAGQCQGFLSYQRVGNFVRARFVSVVDTGLKFFGPNYLF